ncbi:MAG: hypothetical protein IKB10_02285 [Alphaproteobacteria bacterium]|nr:hypothetical protein [Alphaproteobacteria bacterium]
MNKLLKLTGVSVLAIVAATGANAAGYTCEELIEYTSCNDGYYLNSGKCIEGTTCGAGNYLKAICPEEYRYSDNWMYESDTGSWYDEGSSEAMDVFGPGCVDEDTGGLEAFVAATYECTACAAGTYQNVAGQSSCITCPAGSECPTAGLASHTLCEVGEYSVVGAVACLTCPEHIYTNADGQNITVAATTTAKGAGSVTECMISPDSYFTDGKGTYHFKSNCTHNTNVFGVDPNISVTSKAECASVGGNWVCIDMAEDGEGNNTCYSGYFCLLDNLTEEQCNEISEYGFYFNDATGNGCTCGDDAYGYPGWNWNGFGCIAEGY